MEAEYVDLECGSLADKVIVITGKLPIPRSLAAETIRNAGGSYRSCVSHKTAILVVGEMPHHSPDGMTRKLRTALGINAEGGPQIQIVGAEAFYHMLR